MRSVQHFKCDSMKTIDALHFIAKKSSRKSAILEGECFCRCFIVNFFIAKKVDIAFEIR